MNIYLLRNYAAIGYDVTDSVVVYASSEADARTWASICKINSYRDNKGRWQDYRDDTWVKDSEDILLGTACDCLAEDVPHEIAIEDTNWSERHEPDNLPIMKRVEEICASFNAG